MHTTTKHQFLLGFRNWNAKTGTVIEANAPAHSELTTKTCVVGGTYESALKQVSELRVDFEGFQILASRSIEGRMFVQTPYPTSW